MLARRFFIICLLCSILGSALSILVAETARPARSWDAASALPCITTADRGCR
ncbi:MAG: hypothetical protein KDJ73_02320 [Notoacmeibacter sp.]|nr:hypothetical protein [Notoacmeibacter sp.]